MEEINTELNAGTVCGLVSSSVGIQTKQVAVPPGFLTVWFDMIITYCITLFFRD